MTLRVILAALVAALVCLVLVPGAGAVNSPDFRLDSIASTFAGKPVTVHCETNADTWDDMVIAASKGTQRGNDFNGYAFPGQATAFVGPVPCNALLVALRQGYRAAGLWFSTLGLMTVLHEAVHLRGERDEGVADCTALAAFPDFLPRLGVTKTVPKLVTKTKLVKIQGGRPYGKGTTTIRVSYVATIRVPNPDRATMIGMAKALHERLPAEYQGLC